MPFFPKTLFTTFWLLCSMLFVGNQQVSAQNYNIDSLKTVLNSRVHDTTKLKTISYIIINLSGASPVREKYNQLFKQLAVTIINTQSHSKLVREKAYDALGVYYVNEAYKTMQSDYLTTIKNLHKSLDYFDARYYVTNEYLSARGFSLISLGIMYNKIGNTKQAIHNYFEGLHIFEKYNHQGYISYALQNIANLYFEQKNYHQALHYYLKAYHTFYNKTDLSFQDNIQKVLLFVSISKSHQELGRCHQTDAYLQKALALASQLNDKELLSEVYFNLGRNEEKCQNNAQNAFQQYQKSYNDNNTPENKANALIAMGGVLVKLHRFSEAETKLTAGLELAQQINHLEFQKVALENLYAIYKQNQRYDKAIAVSEKLSVIKDSIKKEENNNLLTKKQLQYEYETKQNQLTLAQERKLNAVKLENQKKDALKNSLLMGLLAILVIVSAVVYLWRKNTKQKQALAQFEKNELRQKLLLSQMNPHFIFNSIDTIQSLIYNKQDREAVNYLTKFSKLTRQILENSSENYITLQEELTMTDNYLVIQQLLYNNSFDFTVQVDDAIDAESILLPPMLTQPFIENAIKHGLKNKDERGKITIKFTLESQKLYFEITDNGGGFSEHETVHKKSLAMKITKERLAHLSQKSDFDVRTENLYNDEKIVIGAKVSFEIPYLYEN
ncbi:tetratricopeptide repeat-containing sensor histidine kinase [Flavobacterium sp.]|uniref:tetratricopeptide repeat-containing sensor histidine kinase n=1 Tax=Flavobacterium sp. TaxID=239 RepID=UPI002FDE98D1